MRKQLAVLVVCMFVCSNVTARWAPSQGTVAGDQVIGGDLSVGGNAVVTGTLDVTGVSTLTTITGTTLDTGQGANELYDMNQNVVTTSTPTFGGIVVDGELEVDGNTALSGTSNVINGVFSFSTGNLQINDNIETLYGTGPNYVSTGYSSTDSEYRIVSGYEITTDANLLFSCNVNSAVIKSTSTAGLIGTTPIVEGEIYKVTGTNFVAISTGTGIGEFGYIEIGSME